MSLFYNMKPVLSNRKKASKSVGRAAYRKPNTRCGRALRGPKYFIPDQEPNTTKPFASKARCYENPKPSPDCQNRKPSNRKPLFYEAAGEDLDLAC